MITTAFKAYQTTREEYLNSSKQATVTTTFNHDAASFPFLLLKRGLKSRSLKMRQNHCRMKEAFTVVFVFSPVELNSLTGERGALYWWAGISISGICFRWTLHFGVAGSCFSLVLHVDVACAVVFERFAPATSDVVGEKSLCLRLMSF